MKVATEEQPDIIVVDVTPRRIGAAELVRALEKDERTAGIPVVVVTTLPKAEVAVADGYVAKPNMPTALLAEVSRVLGR